MSVDFSSPRFLSLLDLQRLQFLSSLFHALPVAVDIYVVNGISSLRITVLDSVSMDQDQEMNLVLHRAVKDNNLDEVRKLLWTGKVDVNRYDVHFNTPLHLACMLGREEIAEVLMRHGALPMLRNKQYWTCVHEAVSFGKRSLIEKVWFAHRKIMDLNLRDRKEVVLKELAFNSADFYLNLNWKFESWIPFTKRFCPEDNLIIYKRGSSIRVDFTLVGFENFSWKRGNCSFIFCIDPRTSHLTSFLLDNERKYYQSLDNVLGDGSKRKRAHIAWKRFQTIEETTEDENENREELLFSDLATAKRSPELWKILSEEVDMMMSNPIADSSSPGVFSFKQATTGYFMFKKDLVENIGNYPARVYDVGNINLRVKSRSEHLTQEDLDRVAKLSSFFSKSSAKEIEDKKELTDSDLEKKGKELDDARALFEIKPLRQSIPPPLVAQTTFEEYLEDASKLGRQQIVTQTDKSYDARVWMADNFPLTVQDLLRILTLAAPHHPSLEKLRAFVSERLPAGFPIQVSMPIFPTVRAEIKFEEYVERSQPAELFQVPSDYVEHALPDLMG